MTSRRSPNRRSGLGMPRFGPAMPQKRPRPMPSEVVCSIRVRHGEVAFSPTFEVRGRSLADLQ